MVQISFSIWVPHPHALVLVALELAAGLRVDNVAVNSDSKEIDKVAQDSNAAERSTPEWRFRVGASFFVLGAISPVFVPLVAVTNLSTEWKTFLTGLLMLGIPEVLWLVAVAVMGKAGFNYIKGRVFSFVKQHALPKEVSRMRYCVGLVMFLLPLLFGWLAPYAPHTIPDYEAHRFAVNLTGDLFLLMSLFVLGGDFWDKVRALFVYKARAEFQV